MNDQIGNGYRKLEEQYEKKQFHKQIKRSINVLKDNNTGYVLYNVDADAFIGQSDVFVAPIKLAKIYTDHIYAESEKKRLEQEQDHKWYSNLLIFRVKITLDII